MEISFIVPVYNRPTEIQELLESMTKQTFSKPFQIIIVEDGSTIKSDEIVLKYKETLNIEYYYKGNTGPGDSRNFGMKQSKSDYFIILDSDCILPENYLEEVYKSLIENYVDCFGGPDAMLDNFTNIQKAINFTMTSFLTTGGIRGGSEKIQKFQPRSFNMGISKIAFEKSKGFSNIHPGEDPDLSIRLWKLGFKTKLIPMAYVFHKRRINWNKFFIQVNKFGKVRPILNNWYPEYSKISFFIPTFFMLGFLMSLVLFFIFSFKWLLVSYLFYFSFIFIASTIYNKSFSVGFLSLISLCIQFYGYGLGFLESFINIKILKRQPEKAFPSLFFKIK